MIREVTPPVFEAQETLFRTAPALVVSGRLEQGDGVTNLKAARAWAIDLRGGGEGLRSHDFH